MANVTVENRKSNSNIVRVITTYRVDSKNVNDAKETMNNYLQERKLPKHIRMVGKAEVITLRGLL